MKSASMPLCAVLALLAGCADLRAELAPDPLPRTVAWREIATDSDRVRVRGWRDAMVQGLTKARAAGRGAEIAREGALLQPDAAIAWSDLPEGNYRCRVLKLGAKTKGLLDYVAYPSFDCRLRSENGVMSFAKLTGSQRPIGLFLPDNGKRMIFLGTLQLGDERVPLQYGRDRERDMAGVVERIGERRWRLILPFPHFESTVDVLELVPLG
ncbi:MAG TPA: DUF4893 domain-containing protein [Allosphingosinicella sp.]|nr:DUF4893 domain-containing protein [Allosphingosinicella sp.]